MTTNGKLQTMVTKSEMALYELRRDLCQSIVHDWLKRMADETPVVRQTIAEMCGVIADPDASEHAKGMAAGVIVEAIFEYSYRNEWPQKAEER